jgi:hypothetical protein
VSDPRGPEEVETFAKPRLFVDHPQFPGDRELVLADIVSDNIDAPLRPLINGFSRLPFCFTLQCCFGHFLYEGEEGRENLQPLPAHDVGPVTYRIAYLALCLENSRDGRKLYSDLESIAPADPDYIQFGSPDWFWTRYPNSFALQVEPVRFARSDVAIIGYEEAIIVQKTRDLFFICLEEIVREWLWL